MLIIAVFGTLVGISAVMVFRLDLVRLLFGYCAESGADLLAGVLPLRYSSGTFARKVPTWRLPVYGSVASFLASGELIRGGPSALSAALGGACVGLASGSGGGVKRVRLYRKTPAHLARRGCVRRMRVMFLVWLGVIRFSCLHCSRCGHTRVEYTLRNNNNNIGGPYVRRARANVADALDAADVFLFRDHSVAPLLDMRRRFKTVMDLLDAMIRFGVSLSRSVELTIQWDRILAIGPVYPITLDDLSVDRDQGIGAFLVWLLMFIAVSVISFIRL